MKPTAGYYSETIIIIVTTIIPSHWLVESNHGRCSPGSSPPMPSKTACSKLRPVAPPRVLRYLGATQRPHGPKKQHGLDGFALVNGPLNIGEVTLLELVETVRQLSLRIANWWNSAPYLCYLCSSLTAWEPKKRNSWASRRDSGNHGCTWGRTEVWCRRAYFTM